MCELCNKWANITQSIKSMVSFTVHWKVWRIKMGEMKREMKGEIIKKGKYKGNI